MCHLRFLEQPTCQVWLWPHPFLAGAIAFHSPGRLAPLRCLGRGRVASHPTPTCSSPSSSPPSPWLSPSFQVQGWLELVTHSRKFVLGWEASRCPPPSHPSGAPGDRQLLLPCYLPGPGTAGPSATGLVGWLIKAPDLCWTFQMGGPGFGEQQASA